MLLLLLRLQGHVSKKRIAESQQPDLYLELKMATVWIWLLVLYLAGLRCASRRAVGGVAAGVWAGGRHGLGRACRRAAGGITAGERVHVQAGRRAGGGVAAVW